MSQTTTARSGPTRPPLSRPRACLLGGVCAGLARHLGVSVVVVRLIMVGLALGAGAGILLYLWLWALVPLDGENGVGGTGLGGASRMNNADAASAGPVRRAVNVPWLLFSVAAVLAIVVLALGGVFGISGGGLLPLMLVMLACAAGSVAWDQLIEGRARVSVAAGDIAGALAGAGAARASRGIRVASGVLLVCMVVLEPFAWRSVDAWLAWPLFTVTLLVAATVLFGPWALRLWTELIAERTGRVREEQRAEIAAHLHDSVLQTLALIQNRAGASSEVARIARAQERELRDWLYAGSAPLDSDLGTELRDFAAVLELEYPARLEVVAVGEPVERGNGEVAAAAREAMLNAARHAGGDISVYLETTAAAVDVFVRDRGPGFDPATVPQGRLGVRESILGRMRRAGGTARVNTGVGGVGTEVHLHLDRQIGRTTESEQQ
ncbi:ATP-binding protein [Leifsonia sp. Root112D2]|uniref:ATP-binding protein n=1 Tax=Leifsonia sp. Root112D2 TaxID=1736426 RepID=UPI0006FF0772|nr:ATP-binding protein [Leifsonia sp. Root112D2]KQV06275.1 hypothetical protein ASC63_02060 [Leifsonia sp. Root112D2]